MDKLPTGAVMERLTSQNSHSISPMKSAHANLRQGLADRLALSEAIDAVGKMLNGFPNSAPPESRRYNGALATVLSEFPRQIALACADPVKGVARTTKFLPTVADVVAWCERETAALRTPVDREDRDQQFIRECRERAEHEAEWAEKRKARPTLEELQAKHGPNWGIAQPADDTVARAASARQLAEANERALLAEYAAAGLEPKRGPDGMLISLALVKILQAGG